MANPNKITRIVLTGGPCAGKTSALIRIIEHFSSIGYKVFTIPEVPTMFSQSGMDFLTPNKELFYEGEKATLFTQLSLEDSFMKMAQKCTEPCIIISDRGTMDISAYMTPEMWNQIISELGYTNMQLRNERYDAVLHLVSAAEGAEQFYTTGNNPNRYEQADEEGLQIARELDRKVIQAWSGHSHIRVINNSIDFDNKLNRVLKEISNVLELPQPIEQERKYIVKVTGEIPHCIESEITQTYLVAEPNCEVRLRRRCWNGLTVNVHTTRKRLSATEELVTERQVNNNLYESMLQQRDPYRSTISKRRKSFVWKGQFFELDFYQNPISDLIILETKGIVNHEDVHFPPFIKVVEDITGDTKYFNHTLALSK